MKRLFHIGLFLLLIFGAKASNNRFVLPDTIDFWKIKLNGKELVNYTLENISMNDTLDIIYFTDTPCSECPEKIELRDKNGKVIKAIKNNFERTPFRLTGLELKKLLTDNEQVFIYFSRKDREWRPWELLDVLTMKK